MSNHQFLAHHPGDDVAVAIMEVPPGSASGLVLEDGSRFEIGVAESIALGHKVALRAIRKDEPVIEYGQPIGSATSDIAAGRHVHVHNLQTLRWRVESGG